MSHARPLTRGLTALAACLLCAAAAGAQKQTDRERQGLVGPVKSVETYVVNYPLRDGKTERGSRVPWHTAAFDRAGHFTEKVTHDARGNVLERLVYTFDAKGRPTGYDEYASAVDKSLASARRHVYAVDAAGRRTEYRVFEASGVPAGRFTYKYDDAGRLIEDGYYYHTGKFGGRTVYAYDDAGRQVGETGYDAEGNVGRKAVRSYDERERRVEELRYDGEKLKYKILSRHDARGRVLEVETVEFNTDPDLRPSHAPEPGRVVYAYDDRQRTKEVATYGPDGSLKGRVVYTFDERGGEVARRAFKADGSPEPTELHFYDDIHAPGSPLRGTLAGRPHVEFEYDAHGNWTRKTFLIRPAAGGPPQPYRGEERVISYY